MEPEVARTAGRVALVPMPPVAGAGLTGVTAGMVVIGSKGRGLLSDKSTGSVWSASAGWVLMMQRGGGEDFSFRSVGSGQSSSGSCFCQGRERGQKGKKKNSQCENRKTESRTEIEQKKQKMRWETKITEEEL